MKLSQTLKNPLVLLGIAGVVVLALWYFKGKTSLYAKRASTQDIYESAKSLRETPVSRSEAPPLPYLFETPSSSSVVPDAFGAIGSVPNYQSGRQQQLNAGLSTVQINEEEIDLGDYLGTGRRQVIKVHRTLRR